MTPAARLAAAIEVLDTIASSRSRADEVIKAWGRTHRFAGSGDRRAIAERIFACLRARARLAWSMQADDGRALVVGSLALLDALELPQVDALLTGEGYAPAPLSDLERRQLASPPTVPPDHVAAGVPAFVAPWLEARFGAAWIEEGRALIEARAPLDLRLNTLRGGRDAALRLLAHDGLDPAATPYSALGLRLPPERATDIHRTRAFQDGWVEVQDESSQIAVALAATAPGATVIDYCAGAGGKTLALAAAMARTGRLIASDVDAARLAALAPRLARSGAMVEVRTMGPDGEGMADLEQSADLVFVDAPCTGSGTWRRHPEAAWRLSPEAAPRLAALQGAILAGAAQLVRPGGRLVYATCSVFDVENREVAAAFARAHPTFHPLPIAQAASGPGLAVEGAARLVALADPAHTLQLTPRRTGSDGFFVALFESLA